MRILVLTSETPAYPATGGHSRAHCLLEPLASRHEIRVVSTGGEPSLGRTPLGVDLRLINAGEPAPSPRRHRLINFARRFRGHQAAWRLAWWDHHREALAASIPGQLAEFRPDIVQIEHGWLSGLLDHIPQELPTVLVNHNMLTILQLQEVVHSRNPLVMAREAWEAGVVIAHERRALRRASRIIVVTDRDARIARWLIRDARVTVVPNCIDVDYWRRGSTSAASPKPTMFMAGHFWWRPNQAAANELVTEVLPRVRREIPDAELVLAGGEPPPELIALVGRTPGAHLISPVADVRPLLHTAWMTIAPLRQGSGSPIKVLESLASGVPVLTTQRIADACRLGEWSGVVCARRPRQFAATAIRILRDESLRRRLAAAGESVARARFDRSPNAALLEQVWVEAVGEYARAS